MKQSQWPLVPPQGLQIILGAIYPLSCSAETSRWRELTVCYPQALRPQLGWNQKVDDVDSWLPHHHPIRWMSRSWSHTAPHHTPHLTLSLKIFTSMSLESLGLLSTSHLDSLVGALHFASPHPSVNRLASLHIGKWTQVWFGNILSWEFTREWQPTPVFLPGESQGHGSLMGCLCGVTQSRTRLKWLSSSSSSSAPLKQGINQERS